MKNFMNELCKCERTCGDDGDTDGPGVCKGLPSPPQEPLVALVLVPRWPKCANCGSALSDHCEAHLIPCCPGKCDATRLERASDEATDVVG